MIEDRPGTNNTDYIKLGAGGMTIIRCRNSSSEYTFTDHLGTPVVSIRGGTVRWREAYTPYGEIWGGASTINRDQDGYTGHIRDTDTGLIYMQARYMDPVVGRFLSNDPVGFAEGGVDYFNRYAYTANDPVNMIDPDGMCFTQGKVSASNPGCRITGASGALSDPRFDSSKQQIRNWPRLLAHSSFGGGKSAQFNISLHRGAIRGAESRILRSASGGDAGSFSRAISAAVRTGNTQNISTIIGGLQTGIVGVGQANFTLEGTLTVNGDEWRFTGALTGTSEEFDFNEKPIGERAIGSETAGRVANAAGASEFSVDYLGSFRIEAAGKVELQTCPGSRIKRVSC